MALWNTTWAVEKSEKNYGLNGIRNAYELCDAGVHNVLTIWAVKPSHVVILDLIFINAQVVYVTLYSISYRNYHKTTMTTRFFSSILASFFRQQHVGFFRSHNNISPGPGPSPSRSTCYMYITEMNFHVYIFFHNSNLRSFFYIRFVTFLER